MAIDRWSWGSRYNHRYRCSFVAREAGANSGSAQADVARAGEFAVYLRGMLGTVHPHQANGCSVGKRNATLFLQRLPHQVARYAPAAIRATKRPCAACQATGDRRKSRNSCADWFSAIPNLRLSAHARKFGEWLSWRHGASDSSTSRNCHRGGTLCLTTIRGHALRRA